MKILWLEPSDLYSANRGKEAARAKGVELDVLDVLDCPDLTFVTDGAQAGVYYRGTEIVEEYDAIILRPSVFYISEALTIARLFAKRGKALMDECMADEGYAISKMHDHLVLAAAGIETPRTMQTYSTDEALQFAASLGYPCILKGVHGSEGKHVFKVNSEEELSRKLLYYKAGELMLQEYLPGEVDYRVLVVGYKALRVYVERRSKPWDFRTNSDFADAVARDLSDAPQLQELAESAARALRREFAGVDIRFRGETPTILEVNRRPGFSAFERTTKYDVAADVIEYVVGKTG